MLKINRCGFSSDCILNEKHSGICKFKDLNLGKRKNRIIYNTIKERKPYPKKNKQNKFKLNDNVLVKFGTEEDEDWYPAKIARVHHDNTYDISYFDGDFEKNKCENKIKILQFIFYLLVYYVSTLLNGDMICTVWCMEVSFYLILWGLNILYMI